MNRYIEIIENINDILTNSTINDNWYKLKLFSLLLLKMLKITTITLLIFVVKKDWIFESL